MKLFNLLRKNTEEIVEEIPQTEYDWRTEQFKIINIILEKDEITKCKIADVKEKGLMVKVENMYAYLPFQLTPWQYPNKNFWTTIKNSLKNRYFDCKIVSAEKTDDDKYKIYVDATVHKFREFEFKKDVKLKGIILKITENGYFVDVGGHFSWKYGTITGFLNKSKYYTDAFKENYKEGDHIDVYYWGKSTRGTDFVNSKFYDIYKEYAGSRTSLRVSKTDESTKIFVEGKFDAICADKVTEYVVNKLNDNDMMECEIVNYDAQKGFVVKHIYHDGVEHVSWASFILQKYIGRTDLVQNDIKYEGIIVKKFACGVFVDIGGHFDWEHGSIIGRINKEHFEHIETFEKCQIGAVISVIYKVSGIEQALSFWEEDYLNAINKYVGKIVPVTVYLIADTLTMLVEDKYKATSKKRKGERNIIYHHQNGDTIFCEVCDYTPYRGYIVQYVLEEKDKEDFD